MPDRDRLLTRILMRASLPLMKTVLAEDEKFAARYRGWNKVVQFEIRDDAELACHLAFEDGQLSYKPTRHPDPTINFIFKDSKAFNAMMTGGVAFPKIKGMISRLPTLVSFLPLMLRLTILLPTKVPKTAEGRALKVKMTLYFITTALSQMNKGGDEDMRAFTEKMPDRIFQWTVKPDGPHAWLRVKRGKTKAGKGLYARRRPFITMVFSDTEAAFQVLTSQVDMVEAIKDNKLVVEGSPEYGKDLGNIMKKIEAMVG
ncbi:MAG TPA: SCP2 sterol-binding domain-containing protein [Candidatus Brocadiia bacterium]|nr:SCP2 sterol-binding domain-containing protein [Candidatus Brocadiia bacterium]